MTETEQTVALAIKAAKERDIHHIVVISLWRVRMGIH